MESSESSSGVSQLAKVQLSLCDLTKEENNEMVTGKRNDVAGEIIVPPFFPNNTPGSGVDTSSCPNGPIVTEDKPRCSSFTRKGNPRLRDSRRKYASKIKKDNAIKDDSGSGNPSNPASTGLHSSFRANLNVISSAFMNHGFKKPFQDKLKPSSVKVTSSYNAIKDSQSTSKSFSDVSSSIQKYIKSPYSYKLRQTQTINYDNQLKQSGANVKQPLSPPISTQPFHESTPILSTTYKKDPIKMTTPNKNEADIKKDDKRKPYTQGNPNPANQKSATKQSYSSNNSSSTIPDSANIVSDQTSTLDTNVTVTNVPLYKLSIGSYSACFQEGFTAPWQSGNNIAPKQDSQNPSNKADKQISMSDIMPTTSSTNTPKESDLEKILKCEIKRKPFQSFLEQQFCAENLNFYLAVEEYRKIADEPINARKAKGMEIYERHFITNSAEPVNIDNSTNKTIKDAVLEGGFCHDLYDIAQYQIFHLLKYDCWPRYLRAISTDAKDKESEESGDTHGVSTGDKNKAKSGKKDGDCKGSSCANVNCENKKKKRTRSVHLGWIRPRFSSRRKEKETTDNVVSPTCNNNTCRMESVVNCSSTPHVDKEACQSCHNHLEVQECSSKTKPKLRTASLKELRSGDIEKSDDTGSESPRPLRQTQEVDKFCILLTNEGANSERIALKDPRESVARWIVNTATTHAMDKNCCEVVDAQTGSTIDPARQAVDALHNRSVRLMGVVYVTVEFLSPNVSSKNHQPQPARVVTLKARHSLTVGTALRPLFAKYMIDPTQVAILYYGTCDQVIPRTQLGSIPPRKLSVMTYQQLQERQQMPRKDYQRNDVANSPLLTAKDYAVPFHQHGDVAFYVIPMDAESKHQKHSATRSNSTNPKSDGSLSGGLMTRFRRKASQAVGGKDNEQNHGSTSGASFRANISTQNVSGSSSGPSTSNNNFQNKGEVVKQNSVDKGAKAQVKIAATVTANDIPYCGENNIADEAYYYQKELLTKQSRNECKMPEASKKPPSKLEQSPSSAKNTTLSSSLSSALPESGTTIISSNGNTTQIPAIYASSVQSEKDSFTTIDNSPTSIEPPTNVGWQPADFV